METLLARQLQEAWFETQVRKQISESSPSPSSITHGPSSSLPASSSSSSASSDPSAGTSSASDRPPRPHNLHDEEPLHDPILQVISDMLMDGDLEDRKCMYAECVAYMKGLYEMIGSNEAPACPETESAGFGRKDSFAPSAHESEGSVVTEEDFLSNSGILHFSALDDVNLDVVTDGVPYSEVSAPHDESSGVDIRTHLTDPSKSWTKAEHYSSFPPNVEGENTSVFLHDEHNWIDDLFSNVDAITLAEDGSAGAVLSPAASVNSYDKFPVANFKSWHHTGSTGFYRQDPLLDMASPSSTSVMTEVNPEFQGKQPNMRFASNGVKFQNRPALSGRTTIQSHAKVFERSSSDTSQNFPQRNPSVGTYSRLKRAGTEIDSAAVSRSIGNFLSADNSDIANDLGEESVSYVQNEHLNAEKCASILNDGLGSINRNCSCCKASKSAQEGMSRTSIIVSTVADLKGLLISCAQAVAASNLRRAQEILQEIRQDASPYGCALQRLAHYFAEGLVARISGTGDRLYSVFKSNAPSAAKMLKAHQLFVEVCPFVRVSHYFANRAILEAAKGASRLHIVDYGILYGLQWPCLISALAEREGGPPVLRITGIDFPQPGYAQAERVERTGQRLAEYAKTYGVPFEYHAIADRWENIQPSSLNLRKDEVVIVNSIYRMHNLLDETVIASNPRKTVLNKINEINPKIFVQGIKNGNYNAPFFMSRFKEALTLFSGAFDMLETLIKPDNQERMMIEREILGRDILNVVACEGSERIVRPETYRHWQNRVQKAGFVQITPDGRVLRECQDAVKCSYNKNFNVDKDGSWMLLGWKGKVVHGLSLWKPVGN